MSKKMTERNTKKEILEAYESAVKQIEESKSKVFDPAYVAQEKTKKEIVTKTDAADVDKLEQILGGLKQEFYNFSEQLSSYKDISEAIKIKQAELKEMFDIEKSAYTLSALVNSNQKVREDFDLEMANKKVELEELIKSTEKEMSDLRKSVIKELQDKDTEFKRECEKKESEWDYSFERRKVKDLDKLNDEMDKIRNEVIERENSVEKREEIIEGLESKITELEISVEEKVQNAIDETTKKIKLSNTYEVNYIKRDFEAKIERANDKIESLTEIIERQNNEIKELKEKLDNAYGRVETLASKTVESASRNPIFPQYDHSSTSNSTK
jgi:colicin import membrane protein